MAALNASSAAASKARAAGGSVGTGLTRVEDRVVRDDDVGFTLVEGERDVLAVAITYDEPPTPAAGEAAATAPADAEACRRTGTATADFAVTPAADDPLKMVRTVTGVTGTRAVTRAPRPPLVTGTWFVRGAPAPPAAPMAMAQTFGGTVAVADPDADASKQNFRCLAGGHSCECHGVRQRQTSSLEESHSSLLLLRRGS